MILSDYAVKHPVVISIVLAALVLFGVIAYQNLNREMIASVGLPQAHVLTTWPGAGAKDVEKAITRLIENQLSTLGGVSSMESSSNDSYSNVMLEFTDGTDINSKLPEIRELLNVIIGDLPSNIQGTPEIIIAQASGLLPIFSFRLDSDIQSLELSRYVDDVLSPSLARIPGVAKINIRGKVEEELRIELDLERAQGRGISVLEVYEALRYANADFPAGKAEYQTQELSFTAQGSFSNLDEVRNLSIGYKDGTFIYLRDIATVSIVPQKPSIYIRTEGKDSLVLDVLKRDEGNTIEIVEQVKESLSSLSKQQAGAFTFKTISDQSDMTRTSLSTVILSALTGTILATLVILFFLHDMRATVIIGLSIPLSVLFAFIAMYLRGQSINMLSLAGITVAIGMIVDSSIVTLENTWRHYSIHGDRKKAARDGAGEVGSAILASTLTSVSVFVPLTFLTGIIGIVMKDISLTIIYSLMASALVSVIVVPFLASLFLRDEHAPRKSRFIIAMDTLIDRAFEGLQKAYSRVLSAALDDKVFVIVLAFGILISSGLLFSTLPVSFIPPTDTGEFEIHIETPKGYSLEHTRDLVDRIDELVSELVPEIDASVYYVGTNSALAFSASHNQALGRVRLRPAQDRKRSIHDLIPLVQNELSSRIRDCNITVLNGGFDSLLALGTGGQGYQMEIYGTKLEEVIATADAVRKRLESDPDVLKAESNSNFDSQQLFADLSQEYMGSLGLSPYEAGLSARILLNGIDSGSYTGGDGRIPIRLISDLSQKPIDQDTLNSIALRTKQGQLVSFAAFSELVSRPTISSIHKKNRAISATVRAYLYSEDQSGVSERMRGVMASMNLPASVKWEAAGTSKLINDSLKSLSLMLAIAIFLVYAVMVIQFERYLQPLVIMASIPFCLIGVVVGLMVFNSALSIIAMLALITLGGTVVNNAIVLVDYVNTLRRKEGISVREALISGSATRLKPILMTTFTTLFGVLPMALAVGNGSEVYAPLGQAIFGGLLTSTLITLFIVPILYELAEWKNKKGQV
ncbi:efflux RND transporter permease subunit [Treponema sp.]